jgi:hypothetical protein
VAKLSLWAPLEMLTQCVDLRFGSLLPIPGFHYLEQGFFHYFTMIRSWLEDCFSLSWGMEASHSWLERMETVTYQELTLSHGPRKELTLSALPSPPLFWCLLDISSLVWLVLTCPFLQTSPSDTLYVWSVRVPSHHLSPEDGDIILLQNVDFNQPVHTAP